MLVLIRVDRNSCSAYKYITQSNGLVRCSLTAGKTNSYVDSKQTRMKFLFENHAKREYFVFCGLSNYLTLEGYELLISDALHLSLDKARVLFPRCHWEQCSMLDLGPRTFSLEVCVCLKFIYKLRRLRFQRVKTMTKQIYSLCICYL